MQQKTTILVTQLTFNVDTLAWQMYFHVRGCNTTINITSIEADSFLHSVKQGDTDKVIIEFSKDKTTIYYIIN